MDYEGILDNLRKKIYHPAYFLCGEEPYYADMISDYIEKNVLKPEERDFNQSVFYGKDTDIGLVVETCRRYPMMASQQVVIVKEAQSWKDLKPLASYLKAPLKTTILVVNYKYSKPDFRTQEGKEIRDKSVFLETKALRDYQIPDWIESYIKKKGYIITPQAKELLADYLGTDLGRVTNELNKLFITVPSGNRITPDDVEKNIGISKEYNTFELTDALGEKNVLKANRIINYFGANPNDNPMQPILGAIFAYFLKLLKYHTLPDKSVEAVGAALGINQPSSFVIRKYADAARKYNRTKLLEIIGFIREADMKSKGLESATGVSQEDILKEMVYKILH